MKGQLKGNAMLMTTAIIWGTAFVAQKAGMDLIGPIAFNGVRTLVGALALIPVILIMSRSKKEKEPLNKTLIIGGICCGLALCAAGNNDYLVAKFWKVPLNQVVGLLQPALRS